MDEYKLLLLVYKKTRLEMLTLRTSAHVSHGKTQKGQICMNIDIREANKAFHRTKHHVETIEEIRHELHRPGAQGC